VQHGIEFAKKTYAISARSRPIRWARIKRRARRMEWTIIGLQKSQKMENQTRPGHDLEKLVRKLDINITGEQIHWTKYKTLFYKRSIRGGGRRRRRRRRRRRSIRD